jgi:hypothetical protein
MTTQAVINHLYEAGLSVVLQQDESINLRPTKLVTPSLVNLVKVHKQALINYFKEKDIPISTESQLACSPQICHGDSLLVLLLELGEQICDYWNDSEAARAEMRSDILSYPPHQREVANKNWTSLGSTQVVTKAADLLVEYGYLKSETVKSSDHLNRGGPSHCYLVNPVIVRGSP